MNNGRNPQVAFFDALQSLMDNKELDAPSLTKDFGVEILYYKSAPKSYSEIKNIEDF